MLDELWSHQTTLREQLRELSRKERYKKDFAIARSAPGIGWFTAIRLILELGNLSRFTSGKKIASFRGTVYNVRVQVKQITLCEYVDTGSIFPQLTNCGMTTNSGLQRNLSRLHEINSCWSEKKYSQR